MTKKGEFPISEETFESLAAMPIDVALALGDDVGALPREEIAKRLKEMSRGERVSKAIVASQALFESRMFIEAQKAFDLMARAMDARIAKKDRPTSDMITAAKQVIDIYMKRFPKVVDVKPQVIIDKKVYDVPSTEKSWFVRKGTLLHNGTWKEAEKALGGGKGEESGCKFNGGGPCVWDGKPQALPVDTTALDRVDRD